MNKHQALQDRLDRLAGPVSHEGVWADIVKRAAEGAGHGEKAERHKTSRFAPRRLRLAVCVVLAMMVVAGVAVGTVLSLDGDHAVFGVGNGQGGHWQKLSLTCEGAAGVSSLVMSPDDPSLLYAGSEEGLYRSRDGAASWERILYLGGPGAGYETRIDPASSSTMYVGYGSLRSLSGTAPAGKLMRSDDGGNTWTELTTALVDAIKRDYPETEPRDLAGIFIDTSTKPSTVYASATLKSQSSYPYPYWRSTDKGVTWTLADDADRDRVLAAQQSGPSLLDEMGLKNLVDAEGRAVGFPQSVVVDPNDTSLMYAGTDAGVCRSTDGGKTWAKTSVGMTHEVVGDLVTDPVSPSVLYVVARAGIFRSNDAGVTWKAVLSAGYLDDLPGNSICSLAIAPSMTSRLYAWTSDGLFRSDDAGETWSKRVGRNLVTSGSFDMTRKLLLVAGDDPDVVFAQTSLRGGRDLLRSGDGGDTWTRVLADVGYRSLVADSNDPYELYATTVVESASSKKSTVVKSVDRGATWTVILKGENDWDLVLDAHYPAAIYAKQYVSQDLGAQSSDGSAVTQDVGVETIKSVISRSLDGGATWHRVDFTGLPGLVMKLVCDSRSAGAWYAMTLRRTEEGLRHREVYRSTDGGSTWVRAFGTLPYGCDELAISPGQDGALYAWSGLSGFYKWVPED